MERRRGSTSVSAKESKASLLGASKPANEDDRGTRLQLMYKRLYSSLLHTVTLRGHRDFQLTTLGSFVRYDICDLGALLVEGLCSLL